MNKEEIQAKLHNYEERLNDVAGEIERLREQLAEAEKPKHRHGDFGFDDTIGNIFDLLKEWSEDLERFEIKVAGRGTLEMKLSDKRLEFSMPVFQYATATLPEAEEIWHKLGQMIATLKRKKTK